ncbi:MAG: hypothetical protein US50_C0059G0010 [Candidatus Nomurabacteria bacterium GW2011_GWB1_37_5]|uniref:Transcriptional repressor PaaX-like central Cas2-like domain-containing protein n=1 Tax=Candidatus Nomurabacteria bacterium GW2011_GWB1_37_5 TaxID=1618742 RepID=A0A0G0GVW0_9BACT|nr:MAG: hypothetical protein US50_C0059G0010 [Candidatus Nomurabacteria bacterium GW2011_GWB1_37_5]
MSLIGDILEELMEKSLSYKGARVNLFGVPKFKNRSYDSISSTLYRLRKKSLVENSSKQWYLTPTGREYVKKKTNTLKYFLNNFPKNAPKNLMVMFDIPEIKKAEREWFRWHLKKFQYLMIQKSVWIGPSPLPKEFMDYIKEIGLKESVKTFKLSKGYKK